ncbi:MAG: chromate transporter [Proteobacteria bacterium]|nr:chromate transporter [Pseudomonadota bacterium]
MMIEIPSHVLQWSDWLDLFLHQLLFSLMSVGGVVSTLPEMHRYLVDQQHWLSDAQFNASIAVAQAAPGPNILFVALIGWNIGMNAGGLSIALLGVLISMVGILLPSSTLAYLMARWGHRNRELRSIRAFKQGMSPIVVALLISTGWILASAQGEFARAWPLWLATAVTALILWRWKVHLLWLLAAGAILGGLGWI